MIHLCTPAAFLLALIPTGACQAVQECESGQAAATTAERVPDLLQRVVVIGASVSAGYGLRVELKSDVQLGEILDCMVTCERTPTLDLGSGYLFSAPLQFGEEQVEKALAVEPTLVIGLDFMFWFGYGVRSERMAMLEKGLALLERFDAPLLIGDLPDMRISLQGKGPLGGPLLRPNMIPGEEDLAALNARLREWAAGRENVAIFPMGEFLSSILSGKTLECRGHSWEEETLRSMLQADLLHPTAAGVESLLILFLDQLSRGPHALDESTICWDPGEIHSRLLETTREDREKYMERQRLRQERKARRRSREPEKPKEPGQDPGDSQPCGSIPG